MSFWDREIIVFRNTKGSLKIERRHYGYEEVVTI